MLENETIQKLCSFANKLPQIYAGRKLKGGMYSQGDLPVQENACRQEQTSG